MSEEMNFDNFTPEQKAEYEKLMAELSKVETALSAPTKSPAEIMLEEKRRELEEKKEKQRIKEQSEKDDAGYAKAKEKYGFKMLAVQENPNGAIVIRKPNTQEFRDFKSRISSTEESEQREKFVIELLKDIVVYPAKEEMLKMLTDHPLRLGALAELINELAYEGGKLRQKKA